MRPALELGEPLLQGFAEKRHEPLNRLERDVNTSHWSCLPGQINLAPCPP
jgi:hypothetical protein